MIVANDMLHDSRVDRHAETLGINGHDVTVLCLHTSRTMERERRPHYSVVRRRDLLRRLIDARVRAKEMRSQESGSVAVSEEASAARSVVRALLQLALAVRFNITMIRAARRLHAHLYICNDLYTLPVGAFMRLLGGRVVYDAHELYPDLYSGTPPFERRILRSFEGLLIRFADLVITVNEFIASEMSSRYGIPLPTVVMNCPKAQVTPEPLKRGQKAKVVLYHGVLAKDRGLENVVLACRQLREGVQVVIRGEGPIEGRLRELARGLENCAFEKPVPVHEVISKAAEADVGIVTYLPITLNNLYASPNKLFEYLQAGLPVVGSDLPFIKKIVVENNLGLVFNPKDPKDIARTVNLITQDGVHDEFRLNVQKVKERFSWENESHKLLEAISLCS